MVKLNKIKCNNLRVLFTSFLKHGHRPTDNKIRTRYEIKGTFSTEVKVIGIIDLTIYRTRHLGVRGRAQNSKIWMILWG